MINLDENIINVYKKMLNGIKMKSQNVVAVNQYNSYDIKESDIKKTLANSVETTIVYHQFDEDVFPGAYEPFLGYIKDQLQGMQSNEVDLVFNKCDVLPAHKTILNTYISKGIASRTEYIIYSEVEFERIKFLREITELVKYFSSIKPIFFIINKLHLAGKSTIQVINKILDDDIKGIAIIIGYDNTYHIDNYMIEEWNKFLDFVSSNDKNIDWSGIIPASIVKKKVEIDAQRILSAYIDLSNMKTMLAHEQAYYYLTKLHKHIERENLTVETLYNIYTLSTIISIFAGKIPNALLYCNVLKQLAEDKRANKEKSNIEYTFLILLTYIQMYNDQENDAVFTANSCIEIGKKLHDKKKIFLARLFKHMCKYSGWKNPVWFGVDDEDLDPRLIEEALEYGFINHAAHMYVYSYDNDSYKFKSVENLEENIWHWCKGVEYARTINNNSFILNACRKAIMLVSSCGYSDVSDYIYLTYSMPVIKKTGNKFEEANVYNGLGFNCIMRDEYLEANDYFNKAISIFWKLGQHEHVCETLYNMSLNCIKANKYKVADEYITTCLKVLHFLKTDKMRICHISKLYGIKALCAIREGNYYTANNYNKKVEQCLTSVINCDIDEPFMRYWYDDVFLYHYVYGVLRAFDKKYEKAGILLARAYEILCRGNTFSYMKEDILSLISYVEKQRLPMEIVTFEDTKVATSKLQDPSLPMILEVARFAGTLNDIKTMNENLDFLCTWKRLINNSGTNTYLLVESAVKSFKNNFGVDSFVMISYTCNDAEAIYNDSGVYMDKNKLDAITEYFTMHPLEVVTSKLEKNYASFSELLSVFDEKRIFNFLAIPYFKNDVLDKIIITYSIMRNAWNRQENKFLVSEDNLQYFTLVFSTLVDAIERAKDKIEIEQKENIEQMNKQLSGLNEKLVSIANFDKLTGLYNRQGFYDKIEEYTNENRKGFCLAYIDLDNFKYYNDNFGHDVGDVVLCEIATLFKNICEDKDIAVRYGGDEFLILFETYNIREAKEKVERVYAEIKKKNFFIDTICEILKKKLNIPDESKISCSIGISNVEGRNLREGITDAIKKADDTLYYIKRTTKRKCEIWDDIKEKVKA